MYRESLQNNRDQILLSKTARDHPHRSAGRMELSQALKAQSPILRAEAGL